MVIIDWWSSWVSSMKPVIPSAILLMPIASTGRIYRVMGLLIERCPLNREHKKYAPALAGNGTHRQECVAEQLLHVKVTAR